MSENLSKEQIQKLILVALEKYEEETGDKVNLNWSPGNYNGLKNKLNAIIREAITTSSPNSTDKKLEEHIQLSLVSSTQIRDAYIGHVRNLKPMFRLALNKYLNGSVNHEVPATIDPAILAGAEVEPERAERENDENKNADTGTGGIPDMETGQQNEGSESSGSGNIFSFNTKNIVFEKTGIIAFITASVLGTMLVVLSMLLELPQHALSQLTEMLNIVVLLTFYLLIKDRKLLFPKESEIRWFAQSLNITDDNFRTARFNIDRVNKVIAQLRNKVLWFIIFLLLFYFFNLLEDLYPKNFFNHLVNGFPIMDFFENVFNAISAAFLYFGFKVLYDKTLDEKNEPQNYYKDTLLFLLTFIISYFFLLLLQRDEGGQTRISNYYNLACGIYNGWAMGLLFGRLISMEYFFKEIRLSAYKFSKEFFHFGAIFILPIYVLANCLYGVQEFDEFPALKSLIFLVCFIGKGFFLLFICHYINFRWLHMYVHLIFANDRILRNMITLFKKPGNESAVK